MLYPGQPYCPKKDHGIQQHFISVVFNVYMIQTHNENGTNRSKPWLIGKNNYFRLKIRNFLQKHETQTV